MPVLSESGLIAVLCFLIISGFSIAHSLSTKPEGFYARRFWRIVPVNAAALAVLAIGYAVDGKLWALGAEYETPATWIWITHILLLQAAVHPIMPTFFPSWSLSMEAMYYAIAPVLVRRGTVTLLIAAAVSCGLFVAWPSMSNLYIATAPDGYAVIAFVFAWLIGWLAYNVPGSLTLCVFSILLGCLAIYANPYSFAIVDTTSKVASYVAWIGMVVIISFQPRLSLSRRQTEILSYLGDLSFPLYMIHYPAIFLASTFVWRTYPQTNYGIVQVLIALVAADLSLRLTNRKYWPERRDPEIARRPAN